MIMPDPASPRWSLQAWVLHILGSVAQFERQLLIERTMADLQVARADGRTGGRRRAMTPQDIVTARRHMTEGKLKAREVVGNWCLLKRPCPAPPPRTRQSSTEAIWSGPRLLPSWLATAGRLKLTWPVPPHSGQSFLRPLATNAGCFANRAIG